jgi:predicted nuclease of predicted toxin-antitoxin system
LKLLLDQDSYLGTLRFLKGLGHDVVPVAQIGLAQADDETLLRLAQKQGRLFVTRDRDFGNLVFVKFIETGVMYLRMIPSTQNEVHRELERVLARYPEEELLRSFVVIEADGHRIRKLTGE